MRTSRQPHGRSIGFNTANASFCSSVRIDSSACMRDRSIASANRTPSATQSQETTASSAESPDHAVPALELERRKGGHLVEQRPIGEEAALLHRIADTVAIRFDGADHSFGQVEHALRRLCRRGDIASAGAQHQEGVEQAAVDQILRARSAWQQHRFAGLGGGLRSRQDRYCAASAPTAPVAPARFGPGWPSRSAAATRESASALAEAGGSAEPCATASSAVMSAISARNSSICEAS
jgi:hypothetical protein